MPAVQTAFWGVHKADTVSLVLSLHFLQQTFARLPAMPQALF